VLISVIIPAFNAAKTIQSTIQSSQQQCNRLFDTEVIIVNDGSTDETAEILKNYQHTCHIIHKTNAGASAARQTGFEHSRGEFIQYLDSDDLLMSGKLETQIQALITHQADIAYGDFEKFTEKNGEIMIEERIEGKIKGEPAVEIFKSFWRPPAATLYSRSIVEKIYWSKTLPVIQDARYLLDAVFMGGKLVYTPGIQARYRIRQKHSLSQRCNLAFVKDCFVNASEVYLLWKKDLDNNFEKKAALIEVLRFCIHELSILDQQLFKQAVDLLLKIAPNYVPAKSLSLKLTSQVLGYRTAEKLAGLKRRLT
jgi:glycosyltransferase involved in cell wall biosynthesis